MILNFNEYLNEAQVHSYGCMMAFLNKSISEILNYSIQIDPDDVYIDPNDESYGIEDEPHITLLYGLHDSIEIKNKLKELFSVIKLPKFNVHGISAFKNDDFDVLKWELSGDDLFKLNSILKQFFKYTNSYNTYIPHSTIAYLKPGMSDKYVTKFDTIYELCSDYFVYSDVEGNQIKI
jgi:hypothetical protein